MMEVKAQLIHRKMRHAAHSHVYSNQKIQFRLVDKTRVFSISVDVITQ